MKIKYIKKSVDANSIKTFYFSCDQKPSFIAGQFIEMTLPHKNSDNRGIKRWFTLSSSPTENLLAITTKFTRENGSSFKKTLDSLQANNEAKISQPMGDFILPKSSNVPLIFVAGGIGCAPYRSMVKFLEDNPKEKRSIVFIYAASNKNQVAFKKLFTKNAKEFHEIIDQRLTADKIKKIGKFNGKQYIYISGPELMVEELSKDLKNSGVDSSLVYTDFFPGYN